MSNQSPEHSFGTNAPVIFLHKRKEVNTMKYTKPEVTLINSATFGIQGTPKVGTVPDSYPMEHVTAAAYEADE
jgi:hypothetical protein